MLFIPDVPVLSDEIAKSELYKVCINGKIYDTRVCRVSAIPFNRTWPGKQRPLDQTEEAAYLNIYSDEKLSFEVTCKDEPNNTVIRPLAYGVKPETNNNTVTFTVSKPGYYILEPYGQHRALHIFVNAPETYDGADDATYRFEYGVHTPGLIRLKSGESVYIAPGATVYGSIFAEDADNIRIFGGGTLDGSYEERLFEHCYARYTKGNLKFYNCKNIDISGVTLQNSAIWVINLFGCDTVSIKNVKIIGQWRYNTDGIDIVNTSNVDIENCFIRAFDDVITLKGIDMYYERDVKHIHVKNCVLWCDWGRTCEVGIETDADEYDDISFEDCYLPHGSSALLDIQNGSRADIHNVRFENIHAEYTAAALQDVYQTSDELVYQSNGLAKPALICLVNHKFCNDRERNRGFALTHDVLCKNIYVYAENNIADIPIIIRSSSPETVFRNITVENLYYNGVKQEDTSKFALDIKNAENVLFK